ncbi:hypothetical protein Tdes44962_MAKER06083 [Teratosphaeria destructans]|uniref:Uncharacterized protein n=1 Tax=Teratosphaeria destructans TaxID=418781 RepID=A0A9W7VY13_9PEZI|nr:hypothetical protein Tdes44962_MAKER06083 [Teratosphaeria destructans]
MTPTIILRYNSFYMLAVGMRMQCSSHSSSPRELEMQEAMKRWHNDNSDFSLARSEQSLRIVTRIALLATANSHLATGLAGEAFLFQSV